MSPCSNWCVVRDFPGARNFWNVERHGRVDFNWLKPRLLQFAKKSQLILRGLCSEFKSRRLHFWPIFTSYVPNLHVEPRVQVGDCSTCVESRVRDAGSHRFDSKIVEQSFQIEILRLKCRRHFARLWNHCGIRTEIS